MRPYRGLTKEGKWVFGWYAEYKDEPVIYSATDKPWIAHKVIPETAGQATGIKDKNGKDLDWWQGDVFELYGQSTTYKIIYLEGCYYFESTVTGQRYICGKAALWFHLPEKLGDSQTIFLPEKAGNIHKEAE